MKFLKLIGIFIVIAAGIVGAYMLMDSKPSTEGGEIPNGSQIYKEYYAKITEEIEGKPMFDAKSYSKLKSDIQQSYNLKALKSDEFRSLMSHLYTSASSRITRSFKDDLTAGKNFAERVQSHHDALTAFQRLEPEQTKDDGNVRWIESRYNYYTQVKGFNPKAIASYKGGSNVATFNQIYNSKMSQAAGFRNNALYKEFAAVPGFQSLIAQGTVESALNGSKNSYYSGLVKKIKEYYDGRDLTEDNCNALQTIVAIFYNDDDCGISYYTDLSKYRDDYKTRLENQAS